MTLLTTFHIVDTTHFLPRPGEANRLVNEGLFGEAISEYLAQALSARGYAPSEPVNEDWGWWVDARKGVLQTGLNVYCRDGDADAQTMAFAICIAARKTTKWVWSKFRSVSIETELSQLQTDLIDILQTESRLRYLGTSDDPFGDIDPTG